MSLNLVNLDQTTREKMLIEIEDDINNDKLYLSARLSSIGKNQYPSLLKDAAENHDDAWLASQLRLNRRMNETEQRRNRSRGFKTVNVPVNAPDTLAEGEFNRFYIRGLCLRAIEQNINHLIIYRAKVVSNPRAESEAKINSQIDPNNLLSDLRTNIGIDTALGLPAGPNSGLSVKLP